MGNGGKKAMSQATPATENLLVIFMKAPRPGTVKTRLQPALTPTQSLWLYRAMCEDLVGKFREADDFSLQIHFWPTDTEPEMGAWLGADLRYIPQQGRDLGAKMHHTFVRSFADGFRKVAIIGSDLPTLDHPHLRETFTALDGHDAVFGPTGDGGYYLIGLRQPQPVLFENVRWSTEAVLPQTLDNARRAGLAVHLLREEADIDSIAEVRQLWQRLQADPAKRRASAPATFAVLRQFFDQTASPNDRS